MTAIHIVFAWITIQELASPATDSKALPSEGMVRGMLIFLGFPAFLMVARYAITYIFMFYARLIS